jgi:WD40 repeat protein
VKFDRKLLTGGCDNHLRLWRLAEDTASWFEVKAFCGEGGPDTPAHGDWVRDAAFAPSLGMPSNTVASASEDKSVVIWLEDPLSGAWRRSKTLKFDTKVYRVSWSLMGNILAVAQGDNKVSLWKESMDGDWKNLSQAQAQAHQASFAPPSPGHATQDPFQQQSQQQQPPLAPTPQQQYQQHPPQPQPQQQQSQQYQQYGGATAF